MTVYIITWKYPGESGSGIVGAYSTEQKAQEVMEILDAHGDIGKVFEIVVIADVEIKS